MDSECMLRLSYGEFYFLAKSFFARTWLAFDINFFAAYTCQIITQFCRITVGVGIVSFKAMIYWENIIFRENVIVTAGTIPRSSCDGMFTCAVDKMLFVHCELKGESFLELGLRPGRGDWSS